MASFNRKDYFRIFEIGAELYRTKNEDDIHEKPESFLAILTDGHFTIHYIVGVWIGIFICLLASRLG